MVGVWVRRLLALLIAVALSTSVAVHVPPASADAVHGYAGATQHAEACHDKAEHSLPAAAKLPACCLVYCGGYSSIPAAPFAQSRAIDFDDRPFATDAPPRPAGHDIHPDPHPPRV